MCTNYTKVSIVPLISLRDPICLKLRIIHYHGEGTYWPPEVWNYDLSTFIRCVRNISGKTVKNNVLFKSHPCRRVSNFCHQICMSACSGHQTIIRQQWRVSAELSGLALLCPIIRAPLPGLTHLHNQSGLCHLAFDFSGVPNRLLLH